MIATAHPIAEILGELLAQYQARGLLADDSASTNGSFPHIERSRALVAAWSYEPGFIASISHCGHNN